jgi:ABC-2 type transport system permease protein
VASRRHADGGAASRGLAAARRTARLYWLLQRASWRSALQYRLNIAVTVLGGAVYHGSGFAFLWVLLHTVHTLAGWDIGAVAFLYGLRLLAHALWLVAIGGITYVDRMVREGEFERMLLRPANPLLQVVTNRRDLMYVGDLTTAVAVFGVATVVARVDWSAAAVAVTVLAVLGGALIEGSVQLAVGALAFRLLQSWPLRLFADDTVSLLSSYPHRVFGAAAQRVLTYVLPIAFVAYLPASTLLGRTGELAVPPVLGYAGPLVGAGLVALAYAVWSRQLQHYQGVGH